MVDHIEQSTVFMDEAGNSGENLLDAQQPVYSLAAIQVDETTAAAAVAAALSRTQMSELKFNKLKKSNPGRDNILSLLKDVALEPSLAAVAVAHKPWMLAAKLVDELVEPRMLKRGVQVEWYASGRARADVDTLYQLAPRALGEVYADLAAAFVPLVRDCSQDGVRVFIAALRRSRIACRDDEVARILGDMIDTEPELEAEFAGRRDALDPALPTLFWQGAHWSERFGKPFEVLHDDSNTVRGWVDHFATIRSNYVDALAAGEEAPMRPVVIGEVTLRFPTQLEQITFGESHGDSRLQVADMVAGAAEHLYAVAAGARPFDAFARDLRRAGVWDLIQHSVGPEFDPAVLRQLL